MLDLIPFILDNEKSKIKTEIKDKCLLLIFDGTSRLGEVLAVVFDILVMISKYAND